MQLAGSIQVSHWCPLEFMASPAAIRNALTRTTGSWPCILFPFPPLFGYSDPDYLEFAESGGNSSENEFPSQYNRKDRVRMALPFLINLFTSPEVKGNPPWFLVLGKGSHDAEDWSGYLSV